MNDLAALIGALSAMLLAPTLIQIMRAMLRQTADYYRRQANYWSALFIFLSPAQIAACHLLLAGVIATALATVQHTLWGIWLGAAASIPLFTGALRKVRRLRVRQAILQLPDALLAMSGSLKAGSSFQGALETAVREGLPPLSQELGLLHRELRMGTQVELAFEHLRDRLPDPDVTLFVSAVHLNREIGGNFSDLLAELATTQRAKLEMQGRIEALTAQGRLQGWVMTGLPALLALAVFWLEPEAMRHLFDSLIGWLVLACCVLLLGIGYLCIRRIVSIDV